LVELGVLFSQTFQKPFDDPDKKPQAGQMGHIGNNMGGVQTLLLGAQSGGGNQIIGKTLKDLAGLLVGGSPKPEVMQGLLADMRLKNIDIKRILQRRSNSNEPRTSWSVRLYSSFKNTTRLKWPPAHLVSRYPGNRRDGKAPH